MNADVDADLVPSKYAAGFHIGMRFEDISSILKDARVEVLRSDFNLNEAIRSNSGYLLIKNYFNEDNSALFYKHDMIRLEFNAKSELYCIFVFEGYNGKFENKIGIGSPLSEAASMNALYYDEGDEMHYFVDSSGDIIPGIAFCAEEESLAKSPDQIIGGICIHDWGKQK